MEMNTPVTVKQMTLEATTIRADGSREELGVISYWHKSRMRRLWARIRGVGRITVQKGR